MYSTSDPTVPRSGTPHSLQQEKRMYRESINPPEEAKLSVSPKTEADTLAQLPEERRKLLGDGINQAYLARLNKYALETGLISEEIFRKMEIRLKMQSDAALQKF